MSRKIIFQFFVLVGLSALLIQSLNSHTFNQKVAISSKKIETLLPYHSPSKLGNVFIEEVLPSIQGRSDITKLHRADPNLLHEVIFSIKQNNLDKLESILNDVSNPNSVNYGKHLKREEISSITDHQVSSEFVKESLKNMGVQNVKSSLYGEYITAEAPVHLWESLFTTTFYHYQQKSGIGNFVRSSSYSLPSSFTPHVSHVHRTVQFPPPPKKKLRTIAATSTSPMATPQLLFQYYDINDRTGSMLNSQAVWESDNQTASPTDLTQFQQAYNIPIQPITQDIGGHVVNNACGTPVNFDNCGEASLDIQYMMAVSQGSKTIFWYDNSTDFLVSWAVQVSELSNPPLVFSISYGAEEQYLSKAYMNTFETEAIKLGLMGVTIMASSGDDGAISPSAESNSVACGYSPQYPASCPYVTAVGATQGPEAGLPEKVCQGDTDGVVTSGGGFSLRYPRPSWQNTAVENYLTHYSSKPYTGFNVNGRGYPDVTMLGHNYPVILGGEQYLVSGTSASSPVFASLVSLVNAARISQGKSSLGWINPALYSTYQSYAHDITVGDNHCTAFGLTCCQQGYYATPGWDPTSGLGSVNFTAFKEVFMGLSNHPTTLTPTQATTPTPTHAPTQAPTMVAGWLQEIVYEKIGCTKNASNVPNQVFQWPTDICLEDFDSKTAQPIGSKMITCTSEFGGRAYIQYFSDLLCMDLKLRQNIEVGCASEVRVTPESRPFSTEVKCFQNTGNYGHNFPVPDPNVPYAAFTTYNNEMCTNSLLANVALYRQGACLEVYLSERAYWYVVDYPIFTLYANSNCTIRLETPETLNSQCEILFPNKEPKADNEKDLTNINYYYTPYYYVDYYATSSVGGIWFNIQPTPSGSPTTSSSSSSSSSLSVGAIAGIAVGALVIGVAGAVAFIYFFRPSFLRPSNNLASADENNQKKYEM